MDSTVLDILTGCSRIRLQKALLPSLFNELQTLCATLSKTLSKLLDSRTEIKNGSIINAKLVELIYNADQIVKSGILNNDKNNWKEIKPKLDHICQRLSDFIYISENGYKLLVSGLADSGKTTLIKGIDLAYNNTITPSTRIECSRIIQAEILELVPAIHHLLGVLNYPVEDELQHVVRSLFITASSITSRDVSQSILNGIKQFCKTNSVSKLLEKRLEFEILQRFHVLYQSLLDHQQNCTFEASNREILQSKRDVITMPITAMIKDSEYNVVEWQHWINNSKSTLRNRNTKQKAALSNVTAVVYTVDVSGYYTRNLKGAVENVLQRSIYNFYGLVRSGISRTVPIVVVLSKVDLFEQKNKTTPFSEIYPDCTSNTIDAALLYIKTLFEKASDGWQFLTFCEADLTNPKSSSNIMNVVHKIISRSFCNVTDEIRREDTVVEYRDHIRFCNLKNCSSVSDAIKAIIIAFSSIMAPNSNPGNFRLEYKNLKCSWFTRVIDISIFKDPLDLRIQKLDYARASADNISNTVLAVARAEMILKRSNWSPPPSPIKKVALVEYKDYKTKMELSGEEITSSQISEAALKTFVIMEIISKETMEKMKKDGVFDLYLFDTDADTYVNVFDVASLPPRPQFLLSYRKRDLINNVVKQEKIGSGHFGEGLMEGKPVALKCTSSIGDFMKEVNVAKLLDCENVVKFYGIWEEHNVQYMVMEYINGGDLKTLLSENVGAFPLEKLAQMIFSAAKGMEYLESKGVVHRDLSARNLLVNFEPNGETIIKISDFGLSRQSEYYITSSSDLPVRWTAPEVLLGRGATHKSDVYSFGIVMWEILEFGRIPFPNIPNTGVVEHIINGGVPTQPSNCPDNLYAIMWDCWAMVPKSRPTFQTLRTQLKQFCNTIIVSEYN